MRRRIDLPLDELVTEYRAGRSIRELSEMYKISYGTVHARLVEAGVRRRPRGGRTRP